VAQRWWSTPWIDAYALLASNTNDTASQPWAGSTGRLAFQVIGASMDHNRAPKDGVYTCKRQYRIDHIGLCHASAIGYQITQITDMPLLCFWRTVRLTTGVEMTAG